MITAFCHNAHINLLNAVNRVNQKEKKDTGEILSELSYAIELGARRTADSFGRNQEPDCLGQLGIAGIIVVDQFHAQAKSLGLFGQPATEGRKWQL